MDLYGAFEDSQLKQILISNLLNALVFPLSFLELPALSPEVPPSVVSWLHSCRAGLAREALNGNFFFFFAQLLHMTVDISFCCQNVINKTWGVERATISPFNHYSICNENFMQCVIFS